jgi:hypothetical protein
VDSKALVHLCGFDRDRGAVVGAATSAARQGWWGSIAGWVRGRGAWPPEGAIPAARRVVWREGGAARSRSAGAGTAGSRGSWLSSPGVDEREELRELAELKHSLDRSGAGNYHEVDFQTCSVASEIEDAVDAA